MELKGNVQIAESGRNVEISESNKQITVTISYQVTGVDVSAGVPDPDGGPEAEDQFVEMTDEMIDDISRQMRREVNDYFSGGRDVAGMPEVTESANFIGTHADISNPSPQSLAEAKAVTFDLEIHAFYELPVSELEQTIEVVRQKVLGK